MRQEYSETGMENDGLLFMVDHEQDANRQEFTKTTKQKVDPICEVAAPRVKKCVLSK
jgi:hypothetical protein